MELVSTTTIQMNKPRSTANHMNPESLADLPGFDEAIDHDFGAATDYHDDGLSRRRWLQLMGASLALGGAVGCRYEEETIAPFAFRPQGRIPGIPEKYATMLDYGGVAQPLISTNYDGRPIKLDGNPDHAGSMGGSSSFTQARMLEFYDPDRLRAPLKASGTGDQQAETTWESLSGEFGKILSKDDLAGVAILAEPSSSPSLFRLQGEFMKKGGAWFTFAAVSDDNTRAGSKLAFGKPHRANYSLDKAKVIVTLDADVLGLDPAATANSFTFAMGRDVDSGNGMSRMYSIESQFSVTGAAADHRLALPSQRIAEFVGALADAIKAGKTEVDESLPYREKMLAAIASDLLKHKGEGVIVAGERQPASVHAVVHQLNEELGNNGKTVTFSEVPDPDRVSTLDSITDLANQIEGGQIKSLVILGGNPVYSAPRSLKLGSLIKGLEHSLHVSCYNNETSRYCQWVSAMAHPLESWQDGYAFDGSVLIGQRLINPLFGGKSDLETLSALMGLEEVDSQQIVQKTHGLGESEWQQAVHDGFISDSAPEAAAPSAGAENSIADFSDWAKPWDGETVEVVFATSNSVYDGRHANNSWLQELPDFFTKISWDNVVSVSPATGKKLGLKQGKLMTLKINGAEVSLPVNIQPGQADGSLGVEIGYGRTAAGRVGGDKTKNIDSIGVDVSPLRSLDNWLLVSSLKTGAVQPTGTSYKLAVVQEPWTIDSTGRDEIQDRMFRDANKSETKRSSLLREGSFASYSEFLKKHPIEESHEDHGEHHDDHDHPKEKKDEGHASLLKSGELPIIGQVSFTRPADSKEEGDSKSHEGEAHESESHGGDDHAEGDHGHAHHAPQWPEAFHMHHELFDLTPGVRQSYASEDPEKYYGKDPTTTNIWGMSIDLNKCTGCNSCVVACQSENNIPVVGKADVWRGREMHWMRIDRYYGDNLYSEAAIEDGDKQIVHQPVTCHHCENAPCETVCPVAATVHSSEGLNDMVYNRCIGTRYCGNNCPYKVRRFNFFNYADAKTFLKYPGADKLQPGDRDLQHLMMNPEVTVRTRGVMEKCTYCVQRIQNTKIQAINEGRRPIGPNEITTACQDACPTKAIKFGDLKNKDSDVAKAHANPRAYVMLEELNNRPRTKYLARVRNVHPALLDFDDRDSVPKYLHGGHDEGHDHHEKGTDHGHDHEDHDHDEEKKNA